MIVGRIEKKWKTSWEVSFSLSRSEYTIIVPLLVRKDCQENLDSQSWYSYLTYLNYFDYMLFII